MNLYRYCCPKDHAFVAYAKTVQDPVPCPECHAVFAPMRGRNLGPAEPAPTVALMEDDPETTYLDWVI